MSSPLESPSEDDLVFPRLRSTDETCIDGFLGLPRLFDFKYSGTTWRLEKMQTQKQRDHAYGISSAHLVSDVGGVCIATQVKGPSIGLKAVAKVKMQ